MYVRNCWYVIAWDHEVPGDGLFTRTVLDEPILLFRTAAGEIVGLRDRCCHRLAPLSKGRKEGDCVRCGYHGLLFDATGRCIEIPGSRQRAREGAGAALSGRGEEQVGVRLDGRPGAADTSLLPDNFSCDSPDWDYVPGYLHYDTPQQLVCDNLLDFSHLSLRAREHARRLDRDRPGAGRDRAGAARHPRHAPHPRRAVAALLPRGAAASSATSTAGSSTTSSCPARC